MSGYDFAVRQGNSLQRIFRFKTRDGDEIDLTGSTLVLGIDDDTARWLELKTNSAALAISNALRGEATLTMGAAMTRDLPVGALAYQIERRVDDSETTILTGNIVVQRGLNSDR